MNEYIITDDDEGHWYLIPLIRKEEFEDWIDSFEEEKEWCGYSFEDCRIDYPEQIIIEKYRITQQ